MDKDKFSKKVVGHAVLSVGVVLKLAQWGLSASEVVLNGAENLADSFVKAPKLGIGKSLLKTTRQSTEKISNQLIAKGKEYIR